MREVKIVIACDSCGSGIREEAEGSNSVTFTVRGEQWELDLCDGCLAGALFQNARQVKNRRSRKGEFACECGKSFTTQRGLSRHQTMAHD